MSPTCLLPLQKPHNWLFSTVEMYFHSSQEWRSKITLYSFAFLPSLLSVPFTEIRCGRALIVTVHGLWTLSSFFVLIKTPDRLHKSPSKCPHFDLVTPSKELPPNSHIRRYQRLGLQHLNLGVPRPSAVSSSSP